MMQALSRAEDVPLQINYYYHYRAQSQVFSPSTALLSLHYNKLPRDCSSHFY